MVKKKLKQAGFTLGELLVVVSIIALIVVGALVIFEGNRARTRDAKRVADMQTFNQALAMYATQEYIYPVSSITVPPGEVIDGINDNLSKKLKEKNILNATPKTPAGQPYYYLSADGRNYTLTFCLETDSLPGLSAGCHAMNF